MTQINGPLLNRRQKLRDKLWEQKLSYIEKLAGTVDETPLGTGEFIRIRDRLTYIEGLLKELYSCDHGMGIIDNG